MKAESVYTAIIIATILGMGWYAHAQKASAEDLRGELAACALRAMNAERAAQEQQTLQ